ncbi:FecR family protein [Sphingosinicella rhizophila]|uniref:FecR domain-containing protein n=1 Tax=Sphingosinicella rhizophila TaxID=3050082 RepID=A0ABU3Q9T3_9SPHN|nr:FecR domain-containing protein [Sphingosinicella sp. GR2756]MDT9600170.1 FecR domain-containing protein [Sphingosinicella sp. GR2756]
MSRQSAEAIEEEAAEWLARIDRDGETPELMQALGQWLQGDTRREGALVQARAAFALLNDHFSGVDPNEEEAIDAPVRAGTIGRRRLLAGGAAALAASFAGGLFLWRNGETYRTGLGEVRRIPLADGSVAAINTESVVQVAMAPDLRRVEVKSGEAWFQVAPNPSRPFLVETGRVRVRAIGTAFSVRRREGGADVLVTEGVVEAWADGAEGNVVKLAAGNRAFVADDAAIAVAASAPASVDRALAWRAGQIDLDGDPLGEAIEEFNRYNQRKLVLADPSAAGEPLYGIFRIDDPEGFANAIRHGLDLPVQTADPRRIVIGGPRRPQESSRKS